MRCCWEKAGLDAEYFQPQMQKGRWGELKAKLTEVFLTKTQAHRSRESWKAPMCVCAGSRELDRRSGTPAQRGAQRQLSEGSSVRLAAGACAEIFAYASWRNPGTQSARKRIPLRCSPTLVGLLQRSLS